MPIHHPGSEKHHSKGQFATLNPKIAISTAHHSHKDRDAELLPHRAHIPQPLLVVGPPAPDKHAHPNFEQLGPNSERLSPNLKKHHYIGQPTPLSPKKHNYIGQFATLAPKNATTSCQSQQPATHTKIGMPSSSPTALIFRNPSW
jgi:hypothetical protein